MKEIRCGHASDTGRKRKHNEDSYIADPVCGIFVIADGMGGHLDGDVASALVVNSVYQDMFAGIPPDAALRRAHHCVLDAVKAGKGHSGMGATAVALKLTGMHYIIAWIGDSRAYLWDGDLKPLTRDQSYVQKMLEAGVITAEEARVHPQRSIVTQALGATEMDDVRPDIVSGRLYYNQKLLLCSDGLTDELSDDEITAILRQNLSDKDSAIELIQAANVHGGKDNITVILVSSASGQSEIGRDDASHPDATRRLEKMHQKRERRMVYRQVIVACIFMLIITLVFYCVNQSVIQENKASETAIPPSLFILEHNDQLDRKPAEYFLKREHDEPERQLLYKEKFLVIPESGNVRRKELPQRKSFLPAEE